MTDIIVAYQTTDEVVCMRMTVHHLLGGMVVSSLDGLDQIFQDTELIDSNNSASLGNVFNHRYTYCRKRWDLSSSNDEQVHSQPKIADCGSDLVAHQSS